MHSVHHNHQDRELIRVSGPRHAMIDAKRARHWLDALAQLLLHASQSSDSRELLAGIDLVRKAPGMLPGLEVRPGLKPQKRKGSENE